MGFEIFCPGTATKSKYIIFINHSITVSQRFFKKMKKSSKEERQRVLGQDGQRNYSRANNLIILVGT